MTNTHPVGHFMSVCQSVMVVEDHDGGDDRGRHHEHDAVEISSCNGSWERGKKEKEKNR